MIKEKIVGWLGRPGSFSAAFLLSILSHAVLFLLAAIAIQFFESSNFYSPPLIFDFVFSPVQEVGQSKDTEVDTKSISKTPPSVHKSATPAAKKSALASKTTAENQDSDLPVREDDARVGDTDDALAVASPEAATTDQTSEAGYVPQVSATVESAPPFLVDTLSPVAVSLARLKIDRSHRLSAKIAMSVSEKKMLVKKIRKWSESLDPQNWEDASVQWQHDGRTYSARLRHLPAQSATALDEALIEISTEENGNPVSSEMRMKRLAFSNFAQFVDYWDPYVAVHNDELNGRFHANTTINVSSSGGVQPKFRGKVTTSSYDVKMAGALPFLDQQSIFLGGLETGVREIRLPKSNLPFASDSTISESQTHLLAEETWLSFHPDGTYSWRSKPSEKVQKQLLPKVAFYIIGEKDARLHIKGVLRGQVLIYAYDRIIIDDDIIYARHPEVTADADDFLGLVSEKDVEIAHPDIAGAGDLHIHASIYAKGRFRVRHLQGDDDATLYIYGSLTAGSLTATEPRYATHITFDKRLESQRPPNFPMSDRYEVKDWDGNWEIKPRQKNGVVE
ncbi:MAG TPA: hypothetical protein VGA99_12640 [bacterium]